jgi:hypothetical protein
MKKNLLQFRVGHLLLARTVIAAILAAAVSCRTVYEVYGDIPSVLFPTALGVFFLASLPTLAFRRLRLAWCIVIIVICSAFSFRQAVLAGRLQNLKSEVSHIVDYMNRFEKEHGICPSDLSGYTFQQPELEQYIEYSPNAVGLHPTGGTGIGHYYLPGGGHYFEDD